MTLRPIERGQLLHHQLLGIPIHHARLKWQGRTLAVLQGATAAEAKARAERLADALLAGERGVEIVPAS